MCIPYGEALMKIETLLKRKGNTDVWIAKREVEIYLNPFQKVLIPFGTETNFASVPKKFHWLIDPDANDIAIAAFVHDALVGEHSEPVRIITMNYTSKKIKLHHEFVTWKEAAKIFRDLMYHMNAPWWKRQLCYSAVRWYGVIKKR